jgi:hypothetical protein
VRLAPDLRRRATALLCAAVAGLALGYVTQRGEDGSAGGDTRRVSLSTVPAPQTQPVIALLGSAAALPKQHRPITPRSATRSLVTPAAERTLPGSAATSATTTSTPARTPTATAGHQPTSTGSTGQTPARTQTQPTTRGNQNLGGGGD